MSFSRDACKQIAIVSNVFKKLALVLSSARACEKIGGGLVPQDSVSKNADGTDLPVIFHDPQTQQRQASPVHTLLSAAAERSSYGSFQSGLARPVHPPSGVGADLKASPLPPAPLVTSN